MAQPVLVAQNGPVATLTLNRPEVHNAFDEATIAALTHTLNQMAADHTIRALVLRAEGKSFCAGADLNWMQRAASFTTAENEADAYNLGQMLHTLYTMPKPTIALVHGAVYGGGVGLVAACDIALGLEKSRFCLSEVKIGLVPSVISPYVMQALGARNARRLFVTAEVFDAQKAHAMGLLHEVHATPEALQAALENVLAHIRHNGPEAMADAKALIFEMLGKPVETPVVRRTAQIIARRRASAEAREGIRAFLEKRPASWVAPEPSSPETGEHK